VADANETSGGTQGEQQTAAEKCQQCGKPPMYSLGGLPLCLDCMMKVQKIEEIQLQKQDALERHQNFILDEMDETLSLPPSGPRYRNLPRRPAPNIFQMSQPIFHNISIANSTVGAVNTGTAHRLDVSISQLRDAGNAQLSDAIRDLTQAIVSSATLQRTDRDDALQAIDAISAEAQSPPARVSLAPSG
jgi:hypothetical protein